MTLLSRSVMIPRPYPVHVRLVQDWTPACSALPTVGMRSHGILIRRSRACMFIKPALYQSRSRIFRMYYA